MISYQADVVVIGGGPAGLAAALKAFESVDRVMIIERDSRLGGILNQCIHPGFGLAYFKQELTGPEFAQRFIEMVQTSKIQVLTETMVTAISRDLRVEAINDSGVMEIKAGAIVLAMGCRERTRGSIALPGARPAGVMTAGTAQRYMNMENLKPGNRTVILGSGDIGLIMARRLILEGIEVEGVYEMLPYANGLARNVRQCLEDFGIPLHLSTTVVDIHGEGRLTGVTVAELDECRKEVEGTRRYIPCDLLLLSVGLIPENELSSGAGIELGTTMGPVVNEILETSVPGIFACGNVLHVHDEADHVSREAEKAGLQAALYVRGIKMGKGNSGSTAGELYKIEPGENVRYTVPGLLNAGHKEPFEILFRVTRPVPAGRVKVMAGGKEIYTGKKSQPFRPGNMCSVEMTFDMLKYVEGNITVLVEEERV